MKRRALIALGSATALAFVLLGVAWQQYRTFQETPLGVPGEGVVLMVRDGDTVTAVLERLQNLGVTKYDWRWRVLLRLEPGTIHAGEFMLGEGLTPGGLMTLLSSGDVIQHRFTLIEGWAYWQLRDALQADERLRVPQEWLEQDQVMAQLGTDLAHPEGWFLPETYAYVASDNALDVLRRAHAAMQRTLQEAWDARAADLPLKTPYDLLTLASIVEKESSLNEERAVIAGVFVRRLEQNWRLQTDPTIIYGIGETFDGDIRRRDLRADTPYNTYIHYGLPPTPIAMPGRNSLIAAAAPAAGTEMFFVANGKGGHVFSTTLAEHNKAVQAMLSRQRSTQSTPRKEVP